MRARGVGVSSSRARARTLFFCSRTLRVAAATSPPLRRLTIAAPQDNPEEYIQCDMEGSDSDTRRQCACDLVRAMCKNFDAQTTQICSGHLEQMLSDLQACTDTAPLDAATEADLAIINTFAGQVARHSLKAYRVGRLKPPGMRAVLDTLEALRVQRDKERIRSYPNARLHCRTASSPRRPAFRLADRSSC